MTEPAPKPFLDALSGKSAQRPPIWLMRQAGRYLPEYREIRAKAPTFLDFCYSPDLAAEATLQPIRRFGFDAAILFSDILVVPDALGQRVSFETGDGPKLDAIGDEAGVSRLFEAIDLRRLAPVFETVARVKAALPATTALIGFCGAPWTVASYMVAGHGTPDQAPARLLAYRDPMLFQRLVDILIAASVEYLAAQIDAGVEAVQIFDSWAGVLPAREFERWCRDPIKAVISGVRARRPGVPVIAFPRGAGARLPQLGQELGAEALGLDTSVEPIWAAREIDRGVTLQGNLDPLVLLAGGAALDAAIEGILRAFEGRPHIFNLGHGILPPTPVAHVEHLMRQLG